ncbi:uncharacterized protein LOC113298262 isoform X2 [Papaver somniferum]|uniref:uncharacterized protein LOC113298262 isoform X2 n=1 Tax=Papaver somniferum TaxID=3469 RepID=UPI000E6FC6B6|nr:uncharacterized protein LOC113298262 isoform X2 [Papaver somniferum]
MDLKVLSWNIRGLGQDPKVVAVRNVILKNNPAIVTIQESKWEVIDDKLIRSLWGSNRCNYVYQASEGASGGIIIMWKEGVVVMGDHLIGVFSLSIEFRNVADDFVWIFTSVYGASDVGYYNQCWQESRDIKLLFDEPWLIGGDFNATLSAADRNVSGGRTTNNRFLLSGDFLAHCPAPVQLRLKRPISDHAPILLNCNSGG